MCKNGGFAWQYFQKTSSGSRHSQPRQYAERQADVFIKTRHCGSVSGNYQCGGVVSGRWHRAGKVSNAPKGVYSFNKQPLAGKRYAIRVNVPGFDELYAEDIIPQATSVISSKLASNPRQS